MSTRRLAFRFLLAATHLTELDTGLEPCHCGHARRSHAQEGRECLLRRDFRVCGCPGFEAAT